MFDKLVSLVSDHQDTFAASGASVGGTVSLAAVLPPPGSLAAMIPYALTVLGPVLVLIINRLLAASAARKRALANRLEARAISRREHAREALADATPGNDFAARAELEAAEVDLDNVAADRADADALEALKSRLDHR